MNSQIQLLSPLNITENFLPFANASKTRSEKAIALYQLAGEKILNNPNSTNANYEKVKNDASYEMNEDRKLSLALSGIFLCTVATICITKVLCQFFDSKKSNSED